MRIWVCGFTNTIMRDWCGSHVSFHTREEAKLHLEKCNSMEEIELV